MLGKKKSLPPPRFLRGCKKARGCCLCPNVRGKIRPNFPHRSPTTDVARLQSCLRCCQRIYLSHSTSINLSIHHHHQGPCLLLPGPQAPSKRRLVELKAALLYFRSCLPSHLRQVGQRVFREAYSRGSVPQLAALNDGSEGVMRHSLTDFNATPRRQALPGLNGSCPFSKFTPNQSINYQLRTRFIF